MDKSCPTDLTISVLKAQKVRKSGVFFSMRVGREFVNRERVGRSTLNYVSRGKRWELR